MFLFCATEAGSAHELVPVARQAKAGGAAIRVLGSSASVPVFARAGIDAMTIALKSETEAKKFLTQNKVHALIVGTAGGIDAERHLTKAAKAMKIPSVAVLDEWYNYALRFRDENGDIGTYLPDRICVQDELSKKLAMGERIPMETLRVTGSPALAELSLQAHAFAEDPPSVPDVLKANRGRPSILFLSEKLKAAYGSSPGTSGTHGAFLGFHEDIVREDLADILSNTNAEVFVLEKLHPTEEMKEPPSCGTNVDWQVHAGAQPLRPLLWHADIVLGMRTKALLEAAILGRKPISYQPNARDPDGCTAVRLGLAELHTKRESLEKRLLKLLAGEKRHGTAIPTLACSPPDAAKNVLEIVREFLRP